VGVVTFWYLYGKTCVKWDFGCDLGVWLFVFYGSSSLLDGSSRVCRDSWILAAV